MIKYGRILIALVGGVSFVASAEIYTSWSVGMEREVDEGFYFKLLSVKNGWRVWRIETKNDIDCRAIKSAIDRAHPVPIGVGGAFALGTPNVMVYNNYEGVVTYAWKTAHYGRAKVQYRKIGEKFWVDGKMNSEDLSRFDGQRLEIALSSWEYPEILVGYKQEKGVIDLTGMNDAVAAIRACQAAASTR